MKEITEASASVGLLLATAVSGTSDYFIAIRTHCTLSVTLPVAALVHYNNVMSPPVRRVIMSIHLDVSGTTSVYYTWIFITFASDVNIQDGTCKETNLPG